MDKSEKMKEAAIKAQRQEELREIKEVLMVPWRVIKAIWRFIVRVWRAIWKWLKSIDIVGMINLTLLVAIIVLFSCLISNFICCTRCNRDEARVVKSTATLPVPQNKYTDNRKVVPRKVELVSQNNFGKNPEFFSPDMKSTETESKKEEKTNQDQISVSAESKPRQSLAGDVIVDMQPDAPVLSDNAIVDGNLYVQNMRRYTLPCNMEVTGNLVVRNVEKLNFCGAFTVEGNIYVNRQSTFGPIPNGSHVGGQVML